MKAFAARITRIIRPATVALLGAALLATWGGVAKAQVPAAGTQISNQASATYELGDVTVNLLSNRVQVTVSPVEGLRLTADNDRLAPIGAPVALPHRLTNTGNVAASYTFRTLNLTGDDYDLRDLRIYGDVNGNGIVDDGEPRLDDATPPISLQPDQSYDVLVFGFVPVTAQSNQRARVQLDAATATDSARATNTDTIRVVAGAAVDVRKEASTQNGTRGQTVSYDLTATSRGSIAPAPTTAIVDGAQRQFVLLRDMIPANTTFVSWTANGSNPLFYHRIGDAENVYTTTPQGVTNSVALGLLNFLPGTTARATLRVRINDNASGSFDNTADVIYRDGTTEARVIAPSNTVQISVPIAPPTLTYYTNADYNREARATGTNRPLFLQGDSSACNQDSTVAERVTLDLTSSLTGDTIRTEMLETGPNTGVFRVITPIATGQGAAVAGDDALQIRSDDVLVARLSGCGTADAVARILVDPLGVVYDARTNVPVSGARVTLVDAATGQPASVFDFDGVTPRPSTVTTGADGTFQFPQIAPGTYRLSIVPPTSYVFPSKLGPANQPAGRTIDASGSYGGTFVVNAQTGTVSIDVPLDPPAGTGLFIDKIARVRDAEIGGTVDYQVTVRNVSPGTVNNTQILDSLPRGFTFVPDSARRQNAATAGGTPGISAAIANPTIANVRDLTFNVGTIAAGESIVLTYRTLIGPGTSTGKVRNSARATGSTPFETFTSNTATADVQIRGGVFTTRGVLMGRVFVDLNNNGGFNKGELAVPGARIFLEDGTYAVTDRDGQWTIYGVLPLTHVVKIDRTTLPIGATLKPLTVNYAGKGDSVFADLKNSELQRINFALGNASDAQIEDVKARIAKGEPNAPELRAQVQNALTTTPNTQLGDTRAQPATGVVGSGGVAIPGARPNSNVPPVIAGSVGQNAAVTGTVIQNETGAPSVDATRTVASNAPAGIDARPLRTAGNGPLDGLITGAPAPTVQGGAREIEELLATLQPGIGILGLKEGDTLLSDQINLRVQGNAGTTLNLSVNGSEISNDRVSVRSEDAKRGVQIREYIGLKLRAGSNAVRLTQTDGFGVNRGDVTINVIAPGNLGRVKLTIPKGGIGADGQTATKIGVELVDDKGIRVTARTPLTLEASAGRWNVRDLNDTQPGVQVFLEGGQGSFELVAPFEPGQAAVKVSAGIISAEAQLSFVPYLRPVVAAGIFEGQFGFKAKGATQLPIAAFERELQSITGNGSGRAAGYIKGRIQGKYLLSMRFDTQSNEDNRLFRDIQPDEFYPVYGDSSTKGFDAQSTGKLYIRVDKDHSYALYGDFTTYSEDSSESLGRYGRALTGGQAHSENEKYSATAFLSRTNATRIVQETRANGTSGVYQLGLRDIRPQSEIVEIVVRDRNNPGRIISATQQTRFTDYTLDGFSYGLLFRRPLPSFDEDGNPVFIRVTYERETGGPDFTVTGVAGQLKVNDRLQIGANLVQDNDPLRRMNMRSVNGALRLSDDTVLVAEYAQTDTPEFGKAGASRFELRKDGANFQARAFTGTASNGFNNPESVLSRGRAESGVQLTAKVGAKTQLTAEAIRTKDNQTGAKTQGIQAGINHAFTNEIRGSAGIRNASGDSSAGFGGVGQDNLSFTSIYGALNARVSAKSNAFTRYEQELGGGNRSLSIGADYQVAPQTRVYALHEFFDSPLSLYALGDTQRRYGTRLGIETAYMRGGTLFSEYRLAGGVDGRTAQAAIGLRNAWKLGHGIGVSTSFENTRNLNGGIGTSALDGNNGTAASIGFESLDKDKLKWTARLEGRDGSSKTLTATAGAAYQASPDLTLLGRAAYAKSSANGGFGGGISIGGGTVNNFDQKQTRAQLGLAYRPVKNDRFAALFKYELRDGDDPDGFLTRLRRRQNIVSADANYLVSRSLQARVHYAYKNSRDNTDNLNTTTSASLLSARVSKDLTRRLNLSLIGSTLWNSNSRQTAYGVEASYGVTDDLLLSLGYNFNELRNRNFEDETLGKGFYLRMRFKFDEDLLSRISAFQKAPVESNAKPFVPVTQGGFGGSVLGGSESAGLESFSGTSAPRIGGGLGGGR